LALPLLWLSGLQGEEVMSLAKQVWLVHHNADDYFNVVLEAGDREEAKRKACEILHGNPDTYVVTPVTELGSRTVFVLTTETMRNTR
jgi:hypothetical protein